MDVEVPNWAEACSIFVRPFAGMTRIRFKGLPRRAVSQPLPGLPSERMSYLLM
jgi:hypothetical protein